MKTPISEVAWRYPEGGGVVTVASRALHPFAGLLGGLFILVDYFLTAALSALSGVIYLSIVFNSLGAVVVLGTVGALVILIYRHRTIPPATESAWPETVEPAGAAKPEDNPASPPDPEPLT